MQAQDYIRIGWAMTFIPTLWLVLDISTKVTFTWLMGFGFIVYLIGSAIVMTAHVKQN